MKSAGALAFFLVGTGFNWSHAASFQKTDSGIRLQVGGAEVELAVATSTAFRLSIAFDGATIPSASTFLTKMPLPPWEVVQSNRGVGIKSGAGELEIDPETGRWTLRDAQGTPLIPESEPGRLVSSGPADKPQSAIDLPIAWKSGTPVQVYGCGNGSPNLRQSQARTGLGNGRAVIPYYWSPNGYAVLAVTENDDAPASWVASGDATSVTWHFPGKSADLYLMPAVNLGEAARANAQLTGPAPVPPRWAFGYLQSRWGWKDRAYIEETLHEFVSRHLPVDAFIYDFEWYTAHPDYRVPPGGEPGFTDFDWDPRLFPEPAGQIDAYGKEGVRFVGIRKPRIGNSETLDMMRQKGWLLKAAVDEQFHTRDIKFADPDLRVWYADQSRDLLKKEISGWWNDEGEGTFTTYYYWNEAELSAYAQDKPGRRLWTLNRAFSPGLQRLGAAAWTGDISAKWETLARTPTDLLNWGLAGMPYAACDIGGYSGQTTPELLSRWMEAGVFFPVMRAHSEYYMTPHFPWLFGPGALGAIRQALELRYRLIPYYYSLAYENHTTGLPLMRPLLMEFPDDPQVADLSDQWLMGRGLMAAPLLDASATRNVYLPKDSWYRFNIGGRMDGGQTLPVKAALSEIPLYVRAGTILPLGPVIEHTSEMPGGPLEVQVYPGHDATFAFMEDDGESTAYLQGDFRKTIFHWDEAARKLSWTVEGPYAGPTCFRKMTVSLFDPAREVVRKQKKAALGAAGSVSFSR